MGLSPAKLLAKSSKNLSNTHHIIVDRGNDGKYKWKRCGHGKRFFASLLSLMLGAESLRTVAMMCSKQAPGRVFAMLNQNVCDRCLYFWLTLIGTLCNLELPTQDLRQIQSCRSWQPEILHLDVACQAKLLVSFCRCVRLPRCPIAHEK